MRKALKWTKLCQVMWVNCFVRHPVLLNDFICHTNLTVCVWFWSYGVFTKDPFHKSHNSSDKYPTLHYTNIRQCTILCRNVHTCAHCGIRNWGIIGFLQHTYARIHYILIGTVVLPSPPFSSFLSSGWFIGCSFADIPTQGMIKLRSWLRLFRKWGYLESHNTTEKIAITPPPPPPPPMWYPHVHACAVYHLLIF